eukprot:RCo021999
MSSSVPGHQAGGLQGSRASLLDNPVYDATLLTLAVPTAAMLLGNAISFALHFSDHTMGSLQMFASGIILAAVGCELLPPLLEAESVAERVGTLLGLLLGTGVMFLVRWFTDKLESVGDLVETIAMSPDHSMEDSLLTRKSSMVGQAKLLKQSASCAVDLELGLPYFQQKSWSDMPWGMITSVFINGLMDGLLLGIAYIANTHAGVIMAIATAVEMAVLGVTFSAGMNAFGKKGAVIATVPPLLMTVGAFLGSATAHMLETDRPVFLGLIGFGVVALLFLVTMELLHEVHESEAHEHWHVNVYLFIGFIAVVIEEWITRSLVTH